MGKQNSLEGKWTVGGALIGKNACMQNKKSRPDMHDHFFSSCKTSTPRLSGVFFHYLVLHEARDVQFGETVRQCSGIPLDKK